MKIKSIESYIDSERQPIKPKDATYKITTVVNPDGSVDHTTSISNEGFNESTDKTVIVRYDLKEVTEEAYDETKHNRGGNTQNSGQFSAGSGGGSSQPDKLKRQTKTPKPQFPSQPKKNLNVQISLRFKMIQEVSKHFKNIDTDKLLVEAEKSDNEWQGRENLGLKIDDELAMNFQNSRVMHRTKDTFSSIEKLARKPDLYKSVDDLNDRTGVRVISKDIREVKEAISYIEKNYEIIDEKNYLDNGHPTGSGYRSYHCIIKDKETGFEAEIQVRTENEDVWANVFHDLYKPHEEKMRRALDTNPEGVKKYANDYSNYLYNIDCCQIYGTVPDLPTELAQAGFSYSKEAELDENDFFDAIIGEIYEMTPDYGYNVVVFDDYAPDGEKLSLIGNYESSEDANEIKLKCEEQGKIAYIYMADDANESFEEDEHPRDGDGKFATKDGGSSDKKDTDISKSLSTRMGRGSMDMGSHRIIEQYNKDNPDSQVEVPQIVNDLWQPMTEYDSIDAVDDFNEKHKEWKSWLDDNPQVKKVFDDMQVEVDEYNKILDDKFKNSKSFFRGSGLDEFSMVSSEGMLEESDKYSFQSLSMRDPSEVGFDSGVVIEYDADFIKDLGGVKTEYTTDIVPIMDFDTDDFMDKGEDIEKADSKVNSLFADEQEVRIENSDLQMESFDEGSIKSVTFNFGKLSLEKFLDRYIGNANVDVQRSTPKQLINSQKGWIGSQDSWVEQHWDEVVGIMKQVSENFENTWMKDVEFKYKFKDDGLFAKQIIESFEEDEHPRDGDGKFTSGGGKSPKEYEQTNKMHNDIENGSPIKLQSNLKDIVSSGKFDDKTKKALDSIIDNWGYIQEKIAKDKGCDVTRDGHFKAIDPETIKKNKIVGKPTNYMENVCASSSIILQKAFNSQGVKSNFVSGIYWGKGRTKNIDALSGFTPPQDTADGGNVVTDELRSLGYDTFYPPLEHKWVTLEDGTIIDGSYGQFLNKVTDKHQRLQIITPDDPRNKWYVTTDKYLPDKNDLYLGGIESFEEDEHPRDGDGKFATKDGGDDTNKDFDTFKKELKEKIIPTAEENTKNAKVESSVINGINDYAKDKYDGKINFVETQGSFAKGTDLAGSSDLDIFVGFDYGVSVKDMEKIVLELGDNVLKPISDKGEYKIMNGADKKYPESYVDGVEVQIIGTTDVTLEQIKNGMNNKDKGITDGMKTATDRSPHHTRFMKEALNGKEEDVRMVKKFFKDAGVYDASVAKQGFSGFSTEVLIHNLGSFDKVLEFFADFKKGSVIGDTSRKFKTPLVMVDPIDENRNLASAFSHGDEDSSTIPNKNLGRLIKTAQSVLKDGKMPEITSTEEDSVTMDFNIDNSIERNEVYSQLYKYANSTAKQFEKNNFGVKVAKDKVTDDFTVDMPRINVDYDDKTGKGSISFGLKEFDLNTELVGGIKKEGLPQHIMDRFYAKHEGKNIVEKDDKLYAEYEGQTANAFLKDIVNREGKHMTKASKLDKFLIDSTITRGNKPFENLTDKPSVTESFEEDEHPRDGDGKFTSKDDGGLNSRVEQKQNVIQSQIDYLQKSMKPESQKYRAFQKVTDEDRRIRYTNKSLQEDIDKLKLELNSPDTTGLPQLPLKQNTHAVQTIEGGMSWKEGANEPLQGFKKGSSEINVSIPLEREGDDFGYNKVNADRQLNTLKLMWNSLGDEERNTIKSFTIERTPKLIVEDKDGGGFVYKNMDDVATAGYWRPSENKLCMRVDSDFDDDQLKGTFTHEVGHSLWHSIKKNNPARTEAWKVACKKIPPTTKYGKYNKKNWKDMQKMFDEYEKDGWNKFPEEERGKKRENAINNIVFYEDRYYNELHSEVHMYMMGNNKYKRGTITKGIEKFLEPYKALHGLV